MVFYGSRFVYLMVADGSLLFFLQNNFAIIVFFFNYLRLTYWPVNVGSFDYYTTLLYINFFKTKHIIKQGYFY